MPLLRIEKLTRLFKSKGAASGLRDFSGVIENKSLHVVLGPSGAGKTTLLRVIAGLEKTDSGRLFFDEKEVTNLPARDRDVAVVFQQATPLPHLTVAENLALPLQLRRLPSSEIDRKVQGISEKLGIQDWLHRQATELSGGEAQKVCLGRALIRETSLLLMDEPFAHLDQPRRIEFRRLLKHLQRETGTTIIFVTHDQAEASSLANHCTVIINGANQQTGSFDQLQRLPDSVSVASFIGIPTMNLWPSTSLSPQIPQLRDRTTIGVPGHQLSRNSAPGLVRLQVRDVIYETHGAMALGFGTTVEKGLRVTFSAPVNDTIQNANIDLFFDPRQALLFSSETGLRMPNV
ncbi:MAG: transporter related protein [Verrucomicrobiales bacterium]|nr:transporter related protein [Verrucomicrobiales bacterium]